jgi:hypothetical protein
MLRADMSQFPHFCCSKELLPGTRISMPRERDTRNLSEFIRGKEYAGKIRAHDIIGKFIRAHVP